MFKLVRIRVLFMKVCRIHGDSDWHFKGQHSSWRHSGIIIGHLSTVSVDPISIAVIFYF